MTSDMGSRELREVIRTKQDFLAFLASFARAWEGSHLEETSPDDAPIPLIANGNMTVGELAHRLAARLNESALPDNPDWQLVANFLSGLPETRT